MADLRLGLRENARQFGLLLLVNAFVGALVGLERTVLPLLAEAEFGLTSNSAALSFIVTFGLVKAATNFLAGRAGDRFGRKRVLLLGWIVGLPVPFLIIWAPTWAWVVFANVLLGINQGLAWSTTVIMKVDLVGPKQRGLAMGLNEFSGYLAVALATLGSGALAEAYGLRPEPFYLGVGFAAAGLTLSAVFVRDTRAHVELEARSRAGDIGNNDVGRVSLNTREVFALTTSKHPALFSASQAGLVNNLNDGLAWGLFPLFFAAAGLPVSRIAILTAAYPAAWGLLQLWTGAASDRFGRKWIIAGGMVVQAAALLSMVLLTGFWPWLLAAIFLGLGTAMVYPTLLAAIGDVAHPSWRGSAVGVYRFWRDSGYAAGAVLAGVLSDAFGIPFAIITVSALTFVSGLQVALRMPETLPDASSHAVMGAGKPDHRYGP